MPEKYRLKDTRTIQKCSQVGKKLITNHFIIKFINSSDKKFAIVVSKKYSSKAVDRNKLRRQIKSILYSHIEKIPNINALIIYRNEKKENNFSEMEKEITSTLHI